MEPQQRGMLSQPGAQTDPCCMGSAAMESIAVLAGFVEEELADCRHYTAFARQAPAGARTALQKLAAEEAEHARMLMAVYYLITGKCYQPHVSCDRVYIGPYCPALRERYHTAACTALNYERAAESTTDVCLRKLLQELGEASYRVLTSEAEPDRIKKALTAYGIQLFLNFLWPLIFFGLQWYWAAFAVLVLLWVFIYLTMYRFGQVDDPAENLLIPYLLWVTFAGYLNLGVALLN